MSKESYIFDGNDPDQERERLKLIESIFDPVTIRRLKNIGVSEGWNCLEVGAGAGSITKWMADAVGEKGQVVAVDLDTRHLVGLDESNVSIQEGRVQDLTIDQSFDIVHCRYVLVHNQDASAMLDRLVRLLKPGGFLLIEEPDFHSTRYLNKHHDPIQQRIGHAICELFESKNLDPGLGIKLPSMMTSQGLEIIDVDARIHLEPGASSMARMIAASSTALANQYVDTGKTTHADIQERARLAEDPNCWSVFYSTVSVLARRH